MFSRFFLLDNIFHYLCMDELFKRTKPNTYEKIFTIICCLVHSYSYIIL